VVIWQVVGGTVRSERPDDAAIDVDAVDRDLNEASAPKRGANRLRTVAEFQPA